MRLKLNNIGIVREVVINLSAQDYEKKHPKVIP